MTSVPASPQRLEIVAFGVGEVAGGSDLAAIACAGIDLVDGDVLVVTSKVVSKAEGRLSRGPRHEAILAETQRVVARMGASVIAETRHGLVMAAAGVDASNTPTGTVLLLPVDPDESARRIRLGVRERAGANVAVIVTDTAGRAWRVGQTDMAIGCAGLAPLLDLHGTLDAFGNALLVTAPAVADELAAAADLVKGKATGRPFAIVRGLADWVAAPGDDGPGARALVRDRDHDLFGLGAREAVRAAALRDDPATLERFPRRGAADAEPFNGLLDGWTRELASVDRDLVAVALTSAECASAPGPGELTLRITLRTDATASAAVAAGRLLERAHTLAAAARLRPHAAVAGKPVAGWSELAAVCWHGTDLRGAG